MIINSTYDPIRAIAGDELDLYVKTICDELNIQCKLTNRNNKDWSPLYDSKNGDILIKGHIKVDTKRNYITLVSYQNFDKNGFYVISNSSKTKILVIPKSYLTKINTNAFTQMQGGNTSHEYAISFEKIINAFPNLMTFEQWIKTI